MGLNDPERQSVHVVAFAALKVPKVQLVQVEGSIANDPAEHAVHCEEPGLLTDPAAHDKQLVDLASEYSPDEQFWHGMVGALENVPPAHVIQAEELVEVVYVPKSQLMQVVANDVLV